MGALLGQHVSAGDVIIDLAWNIDCCELLQWCHDRGVLYVNTSVELWDPYAELEECARQKMTLYWRHMKLRALTAKWKTPGPTAVLEHGANPGFDFPFHQARSPGHRPAHPQGQEGHRPRAEKIGQLIADQKFNRTRDAARREGDPLQ